MTAELLSRLQFAFTISFHYIFPPLNIGLAILIVVMEGLYLKTKDRAYMYMTRFWIRIFALIFSMGVATGVVMEFEFGTNWGFFSSYVGDIFGSMLASEALFAFALESGFLGILLFGWDRVSPRMHLFSAVMVMLGSIFSAVWIVAANSWMQTPAGYTLAGSGPTLRVEAAHFGAILFNPSFADRFLHVILGAVLSGAFLVLSVHAYYILKNRYEDMAGKGFKIALIAAAAAAVLQLLSGHMSAHGVAAHQPAKLAAFEGHFQDSAAADLYLLGWADSRSKKTAGLKIPGGLSFLVHGSFSKKMPGLNAFPHDETPPAVNAIFQFYHLMAGLGFAMIALSAAGIFLMYRGALFSNRLMMSAFLFSVLMPQAANQLGWWATELGRQPWAVYGLLKTSAGVSPALGAGKVWFSLIFFVIIYLLLFSLFLFLLDQKIKHGPYEERKLFNIPGASPRNIFRKKT